MNTGDQPGMEFEPEFDEQAGGELERQLAGGAPLTSPPHVPDDDQSDYPPGSDQTGSRVPKRPAPTGGATAAAVPEDEAE